jgi:hypothetical protein
LQRAQISRQRKASTHVSPSFIIVNPYFTTNPANSTKNVGSLGKEGRLQQASQDWLGGASAARQTLVIKKFMCGRMAPAHNIPEK